MSMQDLTSDMLTRIRNAVRNGAKSVRVKNNRLNFGVAKVLKDEGYITDFARSDDGPVPLIDVTLRYGPRGEKLINRIDRVSKPGCRVYAKCDELPVPIDGLGISIVSTSSGVMSNRQALESKVGGEVIAQVY
jgi:small subunit ribosomal protein S8